MPNFIKELLFGKQRAPQVGIYSTNSLGGEVTPMSTISDALIAYEENPWVYAAVRLISTEVARSKLRLFKNQKGEIVEVLDHPALRLIHRPNEYNSFYELIEGLQIWLELAGESPLYVDLDGTGKPREMHLLDPRYLKIKPDPINYIDGFIYKPPTLSELKLTTDEVILFKEFSPLSEYRGHAPIMSARYNVDADTFANEWNRKFFENDATPRTVLKTPNSLNEDVRQRMRTAWDSLFKGRGKNSKLAILEGGLDIQVIQQTMKDMDFSTLGDKNRDRILSAFRVPKALLGVDHDLNRASAEAMIYIFARNTIVPKLKSIESKLNNELLPLYGKLGEGLFFQFDDPAEDGQEQVLARYTTLSNVGAISPNEIRAEQGLAPVNGGDEPFVETGRVPLSMAHERVWELIDAYDPDTSIEDKITGKAIDDAETRSVYGEQREIVREIRTSKLKRREKLYERKAKELFKIQRKGVMAKLNATRGAEVRTPSIDDLFDEAENIEISMDMFEVLNRRIVKEGGEDTIDIMKSDQEFDNTRANVAAKNLTIKLVGQITKTTKDAIRDEIAASIEAGESIDMLAERIQSVFDQADKVRATLIARTETSIAYNSGAVEAMQQLGATKKEWLTAGDERVRASHVEAEAEGALFMDDHFANGLLYPCEIGAPAAEVCNCRCTLLPVK